jgi:hypothetical protein
LYNSGIILIWHLKRAVPRSEVLLFIKKSFVSETGKSVCTLTIVLSLGPPVSYPTIFFSYEDSRKYRRGCNDLEPA